MNSPARRVAEPGGRELFGGRFLGRRLDGNGANCGLRDLGGAILSGPRNFELARLTGGNDRGDLEGQCARNALPRACVVQRDHDSES